MRKTIFILSLIVFCFLELRSLIKINSSVQKLVENTNNECVIPENYEKTYLRIYSGAFSNKTIFHVFNSFFDKTPNKCPCMEMAKFTVKNNSKITALNITNTLVTALFLEFQISQKECHRYLLNHYNFDKKIIGACDASRQYFIKSFDQLTTNEYLQIIVMMKNIGLYLSLIHI